MAGEDRISARQLLACGYLAMVIEFLVRPFSAPAALPARVQLPAAALDLALSLLLLWPVRLRRGGVAGQLQAASQGLGRSVLVLMLLTMAAGGGAALWEMYGFLRFNGEGQLAFPALLVLVLGAAYYAVRMGAEGLGRVSGVVLVLFLLSLALIALSNLQGLRLQNLSLDPAAGGAVAGAALRGFRFSPALLAVLVLGQKTGQKRLPLGRLLAGLFVTFFSFTLLGEMALGPAAAGQRQPAYTLARIGSLSVFRRLDSLHASIWMMALLLRVIALAAAAELSLRRVLPVRLRRYAAAVSVGLVAAFGLLLQQQPFSGWERGLTFSGVVSVLLLALIPSKGTKGKGEDKKEGRASGDEEKV